MILPLLTLLGVRHSPAKPRRFLGSPNAAFRGRQRAKTTACTTRGVLTNVSTSANPRLRVCSAISWPSLRSGSEFNGERGTLACIFLGTVPLLSLPFRPRGKNAFREAPPSWFDDPDFFALRITSTNTSSHLRLDGQHAEVAARFRFHSLPMARRQSFLRILSRIST